MGVLHRRWIGIVLLMATALSRPARADDVPFADPDTEAARRHFERGAALFEQGRYADAAAEFETAKRLKPSPAFDYNIARCKDRLEQWGAAADAYERYLAAAPGAADAAEVRARVGVLRARIAEQPAPGPRAASVPSLAPTALSSPPPLLHRHRVATWAVGGAGVALLAGSLVAGLVAHSRYGDLKSKCATDGGCDATKVPDAQNLIDGGNRAAVASDALLGVGLAAVAAGVVLFFVEGRHPDERRVWRIAPAVGFQSAAIAIEAAW